MNHQLPPTIRKFGFRPSVFILLAMILVLPGAWGIARALAAAGHPDKTETTPWVYQVNDINTQFPIYWSWDSSAIVGDNLYFGIDSSNPAGIGLWKSDGSSAGTVRVYHGYEPREITAAGQSLFFESYDPETFDSLLLVSDGTQAGTRVLKRWSFRDSGCTPVDLKFINNLLFFQCGPAVPQLWISDGTITGTVMLSGFQSLDRMLAIGDTLYMAASKTGRQDQLWKSDGTPGDTQLIKDLQPGSVDTLVIVNGLLYFSAYNGVDGYGLWKSDGTPGGTIKIKDFIRPAFQDIPANLIDVNGTLFFSIWEDTGSGLWKSDGTDAGTVKVKDFSFILDSELGHIKNTLFFSADDGEHGIELWKSDSTLAGTVMVKDINPGNADSVPQYFTNVAGTMFFIAKNRVYDWELWKTDGTVGGTGLVKDILPGTGSSHVTGLIDFGGTLFFFADSGTGLALWQSHGTQTTTPVKLLSPVGGSSSPTDLIEMNGQAFFAANDGIHGSELWKSNGSASGTILVTDIYSGSNSAFGDPASGLVSFQAASIGNSLFFIANDGLHGPELWKMDGTSGGTALVKDILPGPLGASYADLTDLNSELFFVSGMDSLNTLWKSDGTLTGTAPITQASGSYGIRHLTPVSNTLFFIASDPGLGLWKSDGTLTGTLLVKNGFVISGTDNGPANLIAVGGTLFFSADDGVNGNELWKSDGRLTGTVMVKDITPGGAGSTLDAFLDVNGILYFTSKTGAGASLWKSDGSEAGTVTIKDFVSILTDTISYQDKIYFTADDGIHGDELWQSDGTEAGTILVKDINPTGSSDPRFFIELGGTVYFTADDGVYGRELWQSDGTDRGTLRVADIDPGPDSSNPAWLMKAGGFLFFAANDGQTSIELWALNPGVLLWDTYMPVITR